LIHLGTWTGLCSCRTSEIVASGKRQSHPAAVIGGSASLDMHLKRPSPVSARSAFRAPFPLRPGRDTAEATLPKISPRPRECPVDKPTTGISHVPTATIKYAMLASDFGRE